MECSLLELDGGADGFQRLLGLLRSFLVDAFQHRVGSVVDELLGLLESEARETADLLDDLDLLIARSREDDVEFVLFLLGGGTGTVPTSSGGGGHGHRSGGGHVETLLEGVEELFE